MSIVEIPKTPPKIILFDWHATLVDTHDAMYHAIEDVLPKLEELHLIDRMVSTENSKTLEDAKLVKYIRENYQLHPKLKADRKVSRTDIFQVLFGSDEEANGRYRQHRRLHGRAVHVAVLDDLEHREGGQEGPGCEPEPMHPMRWSGCCAVAPVGGRGGLGDVGRGHRRLQDVQPLVNQ